MIAPEKLELESALDSARTVAPGPAFDSSMESSVEAAALLAAEDVDERTAGLVAPEPPRPSELKYRLTLLLFPSILLIFVALYVSSLASGAEPEISLLYAGGASVVLAILARAAVGIVGDGSGPDEQNERERLALARIGELQSQMMAAKAAQQAHAAEHAISAGKSAGTSGKE